MDANKSELVLSNSMFASDEQFSEDDLLDGGQAVTWLNDDENEKLDMSINIDATNMFFNRVESAEIIYQAKKKTCKMIGKYVMGDKLGEGKSIECNFSLGQIKVDLDRIFYLLKIHHCTSLCRLIWKSQRSIRFGNIVQKSR